MDIKLRARLSAYSKVDSISGINTNIPDPDATAEGHILGVGDDGKYTLFPSITTSDIDLLFEGNSTETTVTKDEINELFSQDEKPLAVTKSDIDRLFEKNEEPVPVNKETIDTLFESSNNTIGTVSYEDIDSLF